jgi:hypothetical protein
MNSVLKRTLWAEFGLNIGLAVVVDIEGKIAVGRRPRTIVMVMMCIEQRWVGEKEELQLLICPEIDSVD